MKRLLTREVFGNHKENLGVELALTAPDRFIDQQDVTHMMQVYEMIKRFQFVVLLVIFTWLGVTPNPGATLASYNDLMLHFSGYIAGGISISLALPGRLRWQQFLGLWGYSLTIEIIQYFVPNRSFDMFDLAANGSGILVGLFLYHWVVRAIDGVICRLIEPNQTD